MKTIFLSPLAALAALALALPADAQSRRVDAHTPAAADGSVEVNAQGTIRVTGWNRNEVRVTGTVGGPRDRVVVDRSGGTVEVSLRGERGRAGAADLEIRVPEGSSVEVSGGSGGLSIGGVAGSVETSSHGGSVTVRGSPRSIEISAAGGQVTVDAETNSLEISSTGGGVRVDGAVRRRAEVSVVGGSVEIVGSVADVEVSLMGGGVRITNATGRVEVSAVSGDVVVRGSGLRGEVQNVSGGVTVVATGPLGGPLSLNNHGGNVELRLAPRVGADVSVSSFRGRFVSELDVRTRREGSRERQVVVAGGGPAVSITTFAGEVKLARP